MKGNPAEHTLAQGKGRLPYPLSPQGCGTWVLCLNKPAGCVGVTQPFKVCMTTSWSQLEGIAGICGVTVPPPRRPSPGGQERPCWKKGVYRQIFNFVSLPAESPGWLIQP